MPSLATHAERNDQQRELHQLGQRIGEAYRALATQEQLLAILQAKRDRIVNQLADRARQHLAHAENNLR